MKSFSRQLDVVEAILLRLDGSDSWEVNEPPKDEEKPAAAAAVTNYDGMEKQQLQDELRRLQAKLTDAEKTARQASRRAREAANAYRSAPDDSKADALIQMIEEAVASRAPEEHFREAKVALDVARDAYVRRILAESR